MVVKREIGARQKVRGREGKRGREGERERGREGESERERDRAIPLDTNCHAFQASSDAAK